MNVGSAVIALVVSVLCASAGAAQTRENPPANRVPRPNMQAIADGLGVQCSYCHAAASASSTNLDYRSDANPRKQVARLMIAMTNDINTMIASAVLKAPGEAMTVSCVTCHRGVSDPRPLADIIVHALRNQGPSAAVAKYRELRQRYFGKDAYDFSEAALLRVAQRFVESDPDAALALLEANLEFFPRSADSYVMMAIAYTRKLDDATALTYFQKALEIAPDHGIAQGYVSQLQQYRRKR